MSLVTMPVNVEQGAQTMPDPRRQFVRFARPLLGLILPVALALAWEFAVRAGLSDGRLVPPPSVIIHTFMDLARTGELARHAAATLSRVIAGFAFGVFAGTLFGAVTGYSGLMNRLVDPALQALRAIPSIAWVPL